ncbi:hypothetical protein LINGRAHAP2_LOCUS15327 [Linum grandiflorum]
MSPNCLLTCPSLIAARQPLPSLMKLRPGSRIPSMAVSPTSLLFSNRYKNSKQIPYLLLEFLRSYCSFIAYGSLSCFVYVRFA